MDTGGQLPAELSLDLAGDLPLLLTPPTSASAQPVADEQVPTLQVVRQPVREVGAPCRAGHAASLPLEYRPRVVCQGEGEGSRARGCGVGSVRGRGREARFDGCRAHSSCTRSTARERAPG